MATLLATPGMAQLCADGSSAATFELAEMALAVERPDSERADRPLQGTRAAGNGGRE